MRRSIAVIHLVLGSSLVACGGGSGESGAGIDDPRPVVSGRLRQGANAAGREASLKEQVRESTEGVTVGPAAPPVDASGFSNTNTVEGGVDEVDYVRYDGDHLFVATRGSGLPNAVRIVRTNPSNATAVEVATIALPERDV